MLILMDEELHRVGVDFSPLGEIRTFQGRGLTPGDLTGADALVVRSVTRVDDVLLEGSSVGFVGSATSGLDHIDETALRERDIQLFASLGANARPVAEYVLAAILTLADRAGVHPTGRTLGVVGVGRIGRLVCDWGAALGMRVLRNDPPRGAVEPDADWTDLADLLVESDYVSLHVPLVEDGPYRTVDLLDLPRLESMKSTAFLINTSRGQAVCESSLLAVLKSARLGGAALDVWRGEPAIHLPLLEQVWPGTPHMAGYSARARERAMRMVYRALAAFAHQPIPPEFKGFFDPPRPSFDTAVGEVDVQSVLPVLRTALDLPEIDKCLRSVTSASGFAAQFDSLRRSYSQRSEFGEVDVAGGIDSATARFLGTVGFADGGG